MKFIFPELYLLSGIWIGGTETIKDRTIYVYLPSVEMVEEWKRRAERQGTNLSKFVHGHVEGSLRKQEQSYKSRGGLLKELRWVKGFS